MIFALLPKLFYPSQWMVTLLCYFAKNLGVILDCSLYLNITFNQQEISLVSISKIHPDFDHFSLLSSLSLSSKPVSSLAILIHFPASHFACHSAVSTEQSEDPFRMQVMRCHCSTEMGQTPAAAPILLKVENKAFHRTT